MSDKHTGRGVFGKGYYIALLLCAAAIGISGYLYYRNSNETETALQEPATTVAGYAKDCLSYNETTRDWRVHNGIAIAAEAGTEVLAAADGVVYTTYSDDSMGTTVVIRHDGGYTTKYSSLAEELSVKTGDSVELGQVIGCVGATALIENALGPHVHFSVTYRDADMDPVEFINMEN